ncbi:sigma 54-interacting transcriptional regulator [Clostridium sp. DL1XJH146]
MKDKLIDLVENENKYNPLTDSKLAELLKMQRENVTKLRKELNIEDSRSRVKPYLIQMTKRIMKEDLSISERDLTAKLNKMGFQISRHTVRKVKEEVLNSKNTKKNDSKKNVEISIKKGAFDNLIGHDGSLKPFIQQAKAAMLYPPKGLHTLILGPTGVGKSQLAEDMYTFSKDANMINENSSMVIFNCADYADNPQLLMAQLFGYIKGAFTGAESDKEGLIEKADEGILFLDEVHRLPPEGQELLFYLIDKGKFRRLGETNSLRNVTVTIIAATTENVDSVLLTTFRRRIPMVIELIPLNIRPLNEKFEIIKAFFNEEANRIQTAIKVHNNVLRAFLLYECVGNVGQLRSDIQVSCARGFLNFVTNDIETMEITVDDIPASAKKGLLKTQNFRVEIKKITELEDLIVYPTEKLVTENHKNDMYTMPYEIYEYIEQRYYDLQDEFSSQEVINYILEKEMKNKVENLLKKVEIGIKPIEKNELINIVGIKVIGIVDKILKIASWQLGIMTDKLYYMLAIHLNSTIERMNAGKTITNPQLEIIKVKYVKEFEVAKEMIEVVEEELNIKLTDDETGFIAMYLATVTKKEETEQQGRVGVLVLSHGSVSRGMVEVAQRLLGVDYGKSVEMSLDESPQIALERTLEIVKNIDEGKGVLLLVDMGSLVTFGEIIAKKTGIRTRSISRVDTLMVIEGIRRAMLPDSNLDDIADSLQENPKNRGIERITEKTHKVKNSVILTICITGHGTALKVKELLEDVVQKHNQNIEIIPIGAVEVDLKDQIEKLKEENEIIAIVGTVNPNIENIKYISIDELIDGQGMTQITDSIKWGNIEQLDNTPVRLDSERQSLGELINEKTILLDVEVNSKEECIRFLGKALSENRFIKDRFIPSAIEREKIGSTCILDGISMPHGETIYVNKPVIGIAVLKKPIMWGDSEVSIVIMPALKSENMNEILALYEFFQDVENINKIKTSTKQEILQIFKA